MSQASRRWVMNAVNQPMVREAADPTPPKAGEVVVQVAGCGV